MKIYFDTIGCRLNQAEIERMATEFRSAGHEIVESPGGADLVIINSCAVTAAAASDSRQKARQAYKAGASEIVLTGCWATISPQEAMELPGVTSVVANDQKDLIPQQVMGRPDYDLEPIERIPLPGTHRRTRAFIKVQDGCDNHCTFCVTRIARGQSKSTEKKLILEEVLNAVRGGTHEVVLTGVNLGAWGRDLGGEETLRELILFLLANSDVDRLRLSSIEPWDMDDRFLDLWKDERMCRHLHIPLQSGSAETLRRMARKTTPAKFRDLIAAIRQRVPEMAITTDVIVGFAGETEAEFNESLDFVRETQFSGGHVFRFSPREGTPAASFPGKVHGRIAHRRSELMRDAFRKSELEYWQKFVGKEMMVLWETSGKTEKGIWNLHGLTENYLPLKLESDQDRWNKMERVHLDSTVEDGIVCHLTGGSGSQPEG